MRVAVRATALIAIALALLAIAAPVRAEQARTLRGNLAAGKPTVVVVSRAGTASDMRSEAYADWASYLNEFAADHRGKFEVLKVTPGDLTRLFASGTPIKHRFATIFFRDEKNAVYYDGMIHERSVYQVAVAFLSGQGAGPDTGLKPFRFRLR
jgi:hypothetical protein